MSQALFSIFFIFLARVALCSFTTVSEACRVSQNLSHECHFLIIFLFHTPKDTHNN